MAIKSDFLSGYTAVALPVFVRGLVNDFLPEGAEPDMSYPNPVSQAILLRTACQSSSALFPADNPRHPRIWRNQEEHLICHDELAVNLAELKLRICKYKTLCQCEIRDLPVEVERSVAKLLCSIFAKYFNKSVVCNVDIVTGLFFVDGVKTGSEAYQPERGLPASIRRRLCRTVCIP